MVDNKKRTHGGWLPQLVFCIHNVLKENCYLGPQPWLRCHKNEAVLCADLCLQLQFLCFPTSYYLCQELFWSRFHQTREYKANFENDWMLKCYGLIKSRNAALPQNQKIYKTGPKSLQVIFIKYLKWIRKWGTEKKLLSPSSSHFGKE